MYYYLVFWTTRVSININASFSIMTSILVFTKYRTTFVTLVVFLVPILYSKQIYISMISEMDVEEKCIALRCILDKHTKSFKVNLMPGFQLEFFVPICNIKVLFSIT